MSTCSAFCGFLAIETRLQLLDRGARQHQGVVIEDVVDVGADRRQQVDLPQVRRSAGEADAEAADAAQTAENEKAQAAEDSAKPASDADDGKEG